jgi:transcriptional regulator with XRE-family HTH domain
MEFREFLRIERVRNHMSQAELAARMTELGEETSAARVGHWETGRNTPPMDNQHFRHVLAIALRMGENEMLTELGYVLPEGQFSSKALYAAQIIDALPNEARDIAMEILEVLARRYKTE